MPYDAWENLKRASYVSGFITIGLKQTMKEPGEIKNLEEGRGAFNERTWFLQSRRIGLQLLLFDFQLIENS